MGGRSISQTTGRSARIGELELRVNGGGFEVACSACVSTNSSDPKTIKRNVIAPPNP